MNVWGRLLQACGPAFSGSSRPGGRLRAGLPAHENGDFGCIYTSVNLRPCGRFLFGWLPARFKHLRDAFTFFDDQNAVERHARQAVDLSARPSNLKSVDAVLVTEAEVYARI